jgi:membrane fusion protein, multidrug efflux system
MTMPKSSQSKYYYGGAVAICLLLILTGWIITTKAQPKQTTTEDIPLVKTQTVSLNDSSAQSYNYSGEVRGRYESQLAFQVGGKIIRRNIDLGSVVKKGDVLLQIDPIDIQQGTTATKAQLSAAESQFKLAKDNLERFRELYNEKLMSQAEFDRYQTTYDAADAQLRQAKAQYTASANQLNYCNLYADHSGVVAGIFAETGQVVGPGQPVVTLVRDNEKEVEIDVPENRLEEVRNSKQLMVKFWALPNLCIAGKIREVAPMANPLSRTYTMRISLLNPSPELELGMTATVMVADTGATETVYIPLTAIYQTGKTPVVWVVNDEGKVHSRPVKLGEFGEDQVQVLEGLKAGDVVVTAGAYKLLAGQKVRPEDAENE